ncbi:MAG TPA: hypothetical protein VIL97_06100 [Thermoanaerobaculia bacterium]
MKHYTEAEMLELHYIPGGLVPAIRHLPECEECHATFEKLQRKLHEAARSACADVVERKPETFWSRQRIAIMRAIERQSAPKRPAVYSAKRLAVAAILVLVIGGSAALVTLQVMSPKSETPSRDLVQIQTVEHTEEMGVELLDLQASNDPWDAKELESFGEVVEWESWIGSEPTAENRL